MLKAQPLRKIEPIGLVPWLPECVDDRLLTFSHHYLSVSGVHASIKSTKYAARTNKEMKKGYYYHDPDHGSTGK